MESRVLFLESGSGVRKVAMSRQAMKKPPEGGLSLARTVEVSCLAGDDLLQLT
jgi:hypothetical protein